ncbi:MAG: glycosyltransferase [Muribaculaceae bacterium]|nr:glycosyltransferase [Muribaculaceae bacterium]
MAQFSLNLPFYIYILLTVSLLASALTLTLFRNFFRRPALLCDRQNREMKHGDTILLPASIIVYCHDNATQLERLLPQILSQTYDAPFEVIVVNDGNCEDVKDVFNALKPHHKNLRLTFIPQDSHSLSRKKLATTLGVKAARHDLVFFTNADTEIPSDCWLRQMSEPFSSGADIVVGHASTNIDLQKETLRSFYRLDTLLDTVAYLSFAIAGKPYRVNTRNLAYRKHLFFDNKGFCNSLNLHGGEDDIFISEISQGRNIATVLSFDAQIQVDCYNPHKEHRLSKTSHIFTSRFISSRGSATLSAASWTKMLFLGCGVAASILALPNLLPAIITLLLFIIQWIVMGITWRKIGNLLHIKANPWMAFPFMFIRPFYNLYYRIRAYITRQRNYTWN